MENVLTEEPKEQKNQTEEPKESKGPSSSSRSFWDVVKSNRTIPLLFIMILYIIVISLIEPKFASFNNFKAILLQVSVVGIITIGMTMVIISGGIDLSVGYLASLTCCIIALLLKSDYSVTVSFIAAICFCVVVQAILGYIISRTQVEPFIITLGLYSVFKGISLLASKGSEIATDFKLDFVSESELFTISAPIYIFFILCAVFGFIFRYTVFGRQLFAVGENNNAAFLAGIKVKNFKVKVYAINGFLIAIASIVLLSRLGSADSQTGAGLELESIAAAVVGGAALSGGKGSIFGMIVGVVFLGMIQNSLVMVGVDAYWQDIAVGTIIAFAVIFGGLHNTTLYQKIQRSLRAPK